jgi:hypothetical protein
MIVKKVAVIQSNYIPWAGYFAVMASVDMFIVYECVQYTKNDWRNRNKIQSEDGRFTWLTIPVRHCNSQQQFMDVTVLNNSWANKHFNTLRHHFARTEGWLHWRDDVELLYEKAERLNFLFEINRLFLDWVIKTLRISTEISYLDSYPKFNDPNERLISILKNAGATHYLSGPAAKDYIDPNQFRNAQINLSYINYNNLLNKVLHAPFEIKLSSIMQTIFEINHEFKCN